MGPAALLAIWARTSEAPWHVYYASCVTLVERMTASLLAGRLIAGRAVLSWPFCSDTTVLSLPEKEIEIVWVYIPLPC